MSAKDRIQVVMDPETRAVIDKIPLSQRSLFVRACIQRAQGFARRELGLPGAPAGKVSERRSPNEVSDWHRQLVPRVGKRLAEIAADRKASP